MNVIFVVISILSIAFLIIFNPEGLVISIGNSAKNTTDFCIRMIGIYAVWLGLIKIVERTGLNEKLSKLLSPVIKFLFGDISSESKGFISINMASNILGLSNVATPTGIMSINSLNTDNTINDKMVMLMVLNATSLQLIPTTVISLRQSLGSSSPSDILLPTIITTLVSTIIGVILCKLFEKKKTSELIK